MTRPLALPYFATDSNYDPGVGPHEGTPTKIALTSAEIQSGHIAGTSPDPRKLNAWQNNAGLWIAYLDQATLTPEKFVPVGVNPDSAANWHTYINLAIAAAVEQSATVYFGRGKTYLISGPITGVVNAKLLGFGTIIKDASDGAANAVARVDYNMLTYASGMRVDGITLDGSLRGNGSNGGLGYCIFANHCSNIYFRGSVKDIAVANVTGAAGGVRLEVCDNWEFDFDELSQTTNSTGNGAGGFGSWGVTRNGRLVIRKSRFAGLKGLLSFDGGEHTNVKVYQYDCDGGDAGFHNVVVGYSTAYTLYDVEFNGTCRGAIAAGLYLTTYGAATPRAITVNPPATLTATATSAVFDIGSYRSCSLTLNCSAISGSGATVVCTIQTSVNKIEWLSVHSFTARTTTGSETFSVACERYVRAVYTVTGSSPSITCTCAGTQFIDNYGCSAGDLALEYCGGGYNQSFGETAVFLEHSTFSFKKLTITKSGLNTDETVRAFAGYAILGPSAPSTPARVTGDTLVVDSPTAGLLIYNFDLFDVDRIRCSGISATLGFCTSDGSGGWSRGARALLRCGDGRSITSVGDDPMVYIFTATASGAKPPARVECKWDVTNTVPNAAPSGNTAKGQAVSLVATTSGWWIGEIRGYAREDFGAAFRLGQTTEWTLANYVDTSNVNVINCARAVYWYLGPPVLATFAAPTGHPLETVCDTTTANVYVLLKREPQRIFVITPGFVLTGASIPTTDVGIVWRLGDQIWIATSYNGSAPWKILTMSKYRCTTPGQTGYAFTLFTETT